jgi:hypothetical protein
MVQLPTLANVMVLPDTVQTVAVVDVKVAAKPDEAVADTVKGAPPSVLLAIAAKLMVCVPLTTANDCVICGAAL